MATDFLRPVRRAVLAHLKGDAALVALLAGDADRIYPPQRPAEPAWPFAAYTNVTQLPFRASCLDGAAVRFRMQGFAKGEDDDAALIGAAIMERLDGAVLPLDGDAGTAHIRWLDSTVLPDGAEASAWIATARFDASVVA